MKNRAVKLLSLLMCMVMIFTFLPVGALADGEDTQPTEEALETVPSDEDGVPKESAENSVEPVSVEFICAPESLTLSVYVKEDEAHENPILPEEDGSYLLLPGFYTYTAECEGYESAEDVEFEVTADEKQEIEVALALTAKNSFAIDAPEMATVATTYAAASTAAGRYGIVNTSNASAETILTEARKWKDVGASYWSGIDPWLPSICWRTGYTYENLTSFDCSGFVGRVLNDAGFRSSDYQCSYGDCILKQNYGSNFIGISIEELVNYGEDITEAVQQAKSGDYSGLQAGDIIGWTSGSLGRHIIIYAGLNANGKPCMIEFSGNGYFEREITGEYQAAFMKGARFVENNGYLSKCTYYPSYLTVTVKNTCVIKSLPCSGSTNAESKTIRDSVVGESFTVTGLYKNTVGNYWYKILIDGKVCYIYAGDVTTGKRLGSFYYYGKELPTQLPVGQSYAVDWTIVSDKLPMTFISGFIYKSTNPFDYIYDGHLSNVNTTSRNLNGSALDNALLFNELEAGSYKLVINANATNYYSLDGTTLSSETISDTPISCNFSVGETNTENSTQNSSSVQANDNRKYSSLMLNVNWDNIRTVGHQISGGQACACYAMAYLRTILDGKVHYYSEFNSNSNEYDAICPWNGTTYTGTFPNNKTEAFEFIYEQLSSGKPVSVKVTGSRSSHHYVTIIGYENVSNTSALSAANFLIIDPCASSFVAENLSGVGYDLKYEDSCYQIEYDTTGASVTYSSSALTTYTVTFDANGGSCSTGSVQVSAGGTLNSLPTPTRSGYDFVGWYWSKTYGNEFHTYYAIDSDTTLYAHWARQSNPGIKINFNSNGGQLGTASGTLTANRINAERGENEVIVYDWSGETVNSNKFGTEIAVNSVGKVIGYREGYSETCLAVPNGGYVMSFQLDNSNACTFMENNRQKYIGFQYATKTIYAFDTYDAYLANLKYVTKGQAYGDLPTPTRDGYVFDGWYTSASGGTKITATSTVSVSSAQTLYAHWTVPCEHNYTTQTVAGTCTQIPGTIYTCTKCGDSYFAASTFYMSSWSATKPSGVDESLIESRIEYRSREKEYTSSANSSMSGWTADGSSTAYGDYGAWSDWVRDPITESDTTQVDRQPLYKYYYFRCTSCGDHNPFSGSCGCGGQSNDWYETWLTTPYTASNSSVVSYASSKCQTTSLGDGQLWYFSSGNLNDTAIGTMDTTSTSEVIQQGYRSRTRTVTTTYYYYRWKNWSLWGAEPISATEDKQVETRTTYRYYLGWDSAHTWDSGKVTKAAKCEATGVKTYTCAECGKTRTETIAATGHNWGAWTVTKAPTASTAGTETRTCKTSGCGKTETRSVTAETVTITFNANGGSCSTSSSKIIKGGSLGSLPTATRSGYTFDGWYTSGGSKVTTSSKFTADNTLTARWTAVATKVKVTFNANGGSCLTGSTEISKGGKLSSLPTATRSGYTFDGWYTAASGGTKISTSTTFSANTTVYAHWTVAVSNEPKIVVSNGSARPGAEVDVTVSLENNPGIVGMTLRRFDYDSTKLQLLSITESGMSGTWQKATGVTWASDTGDNAYNGVFLTLKFKVLDTAETGATPVSVYYEEGDICNNALDDVNFTPVAGQVNISLRVPGDTNGDGKVNTKDFIAVMKYLAGEGSGDTASCDVNGDGKVNTKDYITLMKYLAGDKITLY